MRLVVLDTNVMVSGLIRPRSNAARVLDAVKRGDIVALTSPALLAELRNVLPRRRIQKYLQWTAEETNDYARSFARLAVVVAPEREVDVCRDPDDNRVLEAAVAGDADAIVSGDADLLALGEFEGIPVVTPAGLLSMLRLEP